MSKVLNNKQAPRKANRNLAPNGAEAGDKEQAAQIKEWILQIEQSRRKAQNDLTEIERLKDATRALLSKLQAA